MYKKVVIKAFEKAKEDIPGRSNKTNRSEHISNILQEEYKYNISSRTIRNLYDDSVKTNGTEDISIKSDYIQNLCLYLGYKDYQAFLIDNPFDEQRINRHWLITFMKRNKAALIISIVTIVIVFTISTFNKQRWMVWEDNRYIEVDFNEQTYSLGQLKIYSEERMEHFLKINPNCTTIFFNSDRTANLWYGKNNAGELEYFTTFALHPETGKTLKEITDYMIRKHICESY